MPRDDAPGAGAVQTTVEMTPLCSPDVRPGRPSETGQARRPVWLACSLTVSVTDFARAPHLYPLSIMLSVCCLCTP